MQETVLVLDEAAGAAIEAAAAFLAARGVRVTHRTPYSVAFDGGPGDAPPGGAGQVAAVPVQLRPQWCRVWVTVSGTGRAAQAAAAYATALEERSRRAGATVRALEGGIYSPASWPAYAATLRAALRRQGADEVEVEARLARFKARWDALGRKASREEAAPADA